VTPAHEAAVRDRILDAAVHVFAAKGYHRATIGDVVEASGLSVGAIYTYFPSKEALFLQGCDRLSGIGFQDLAARLAGGSTLTERLAIAVRTYVDTIDDSDGGPGQVSLLGAWAEAGGEPSVREMLRRRREGLVTVAGMLLGEGIARGELAAHLDVDDLAHALTAMLDGLLLQRVEAGPAHRPADLERRAQAILDLLLATGTAADRPAAEAARGRLDA